ncbi:MAG: hypothetical protein GKR87_02865 [Kiritimatiellae bacterium]|nr:hypothetical protein [Kiritimatiellia bacterium]
MEWLIKYKQKSGKICVVADITLRRKRSKLVSKTQIEWPKNIARHSYATYHLALYEDPLKTSFQLGHHDTHLLYQHYRGLATKKEAETFWNIEPHKSAKIIPLQKIKA